RRDLFHGPQQKGGPGGPGRCGRGGVRPLPQVRAGGERRRPLAQPGLLRPSAVPSGDHHDDGGGGGWED
ncbi:Transcriptional regulator, partial [Dysosmobacter welbionis]